MALKTTLSLAEFEQAQKTLVNVAIRTPLLKCDWLSEMTDIPVFLKCENLQRTGSFKLRGA
ncbi:pyridoxal-phosphate dependent enzyme, partial [bacterium]|nr:pyridoxal-phosphate dependent enzyme [bacterium]